MGISFLSQKFIVADMNLPQARNTNITVQELENETLIYDLTIDKAYCLNETLAIVFNACGRGETFARLKSEYKFTDDLINLALEKLKTNNLLADERHVAVDFGGLSRRQAIRRAGLASLIALPVISSLVAPRAASAASGAQDNGLTCTRTATSGSTECKSGRCRATNAFAYNSADGTTSFVSGDGLRCCRNATGSTTGSYSNGRGSGVCNFSTTCCTGTGSETLDANNSRYVCTCSATS